MLRKTPGISSLLISTFPVHSPFFVVVENRVSAELISIKSEEWQAENKTALSQTDVILPPCGKSDFNML